MKKATLKPKLFSYSIMAVAFSLLLVITIIACQKDDKPEQIFDQFNAAAAKEWYYGVFKKSQEWSNSAEHGKKLPDWKHGIYKRIGNIEIVEFPLVAAKKSVLIPSNENLTLTDKRRITESSLNKISFIRKSNKIIEVREINYVPTLLYLQKYQYDISSSSLLNSNSDFTGQVIIKKWKGDILSIKQVDNGKIKRIIKLKSNSSTPGDVSYRENSDNECDGAGDMWQCLFEYICDVTTYSDGMEVYDNCEWVNTGFCWPVECSGGDPDPCEGLTEEQCACEIYGVGCGGDGGGEDGQCDATALSQAIEDFNNYSLITTPTNVDHNANVTGDDPDPIIGSVTWTVIKALVANWEIRSNCDYKYYHTKYMTTDFHWVDDFDLFYFQSGNGYYVGSNTLITSTYTTTTPTTNNVINNNGPNATGISHVRGVIKHESNLKIRFPFCDPITLRTEDEVSNYLYFHPK